MRHIPEDELHAYLDQGLSRSQCVEIESHLAGCPHCQSRRDGIAALRDRTTALLAKLAPPRSFPSPFEALRGRAAIKASKRRRRLRRVAWAASVAASVGIGWSASLVLGPGTADRVAVATAPAPRAVARPTATATSQPAATSLPAPPVAAAVVRQAPPDSVATRAARRPVRRARRPSPRPEAPPASAQRVIPPPELELSSIDIPRADEFELDGMWRTMSWVGAQAEAGDQVPHIDGLPVVQVQVQASKQGKQPLMVVAQRLASGEVIRTIEGPATDVSHLLSRRSMSDPYPTAGTADSIRARLLGLIPADRTMAMQRGDRMIAITGSLPPDSLLAMIRRLNAGMRSK
ncbi:MAG: anti-sigma factor family protein [Gemmatimonadales bacterium]